jgi:hypothetical protein
MKEYHHQHKQKFDTVPPTFDSQKQEQYNPETKKLPDIAIAIPFTNGDFALIDKLDHDLSYMSWHVSSTKGHVQHKVTEKNGKRSYIFLHRIIGERILNRPLTRNDFIEYKNENKLDNRRENLFHTTRSEAVQRSKISTANKSGYKGVNYNKSKNRWQARIKFHGQTKSLGYYHTPEEAAQAYNEAAIELYGEHARLNSMPETSSDDLPQNISRQGT